MKKIYGILVCLSASVLTANLTEFKKRLKIGDDIVADYRTIADDPAVSDQVKLALTQDAYRKYARAWWFRKGDDIPKELIAEYETIIRANTDAMNALKEKVKNAKLSKNNLKGRALLMQKVLQQATETQPEVAAAA